MSLNVNYLTSYDIRYIRITWVDYLNWTRCRIVPVPAFLKLLSSSRPGIRLTEAALGLVFINLAEGFGASGEWFYVLDLSTLRRCDASAPKHASVLGFFQRAIPAPGLPLASPLCPRGRLERVVRSAQEGPQGIKFRMGFELEVIYLRSVAPLEAANEYSWSLTRATPAGSDIAKALEETADALEYMGIVLEMYHSEAAPGQYEFVLGHLPPLEAVDGLVAAREAIVNIAGKHGFKATFAPRLYNDTCGSGLHVHLSLSSPSDSPPANVPSAPGFTNLEASFLQGLLDHLPAVCAFSLPTEASYARMVDGIWAGGTYPTWGRENRESAVRLCGEENNYHLEVRANDGTACPYIAMAALLAGGMLGVGQNAPLVAQDCQSSAHLMTAEQRDGMGIRGRLPLNLEEAREYLEKDKQLVEMLGPEFVEKFLSVNKTLQASLRDEDPVKALRKLVDHY